MSAVPGAAPRRFAPLLVLGFIFLAALVHLYLTRRPAAPGDLPRLFPVPDFTLTSEQGRSVSLSDLRGSVWIADFIFTRCGGSCPLMTQRMAGLAESLKGVSPLRFVSFDVDPDHDGVPELLAYAKAAGADSARWSFLRGEKPVIRTLVTQGFKLAVQDADPKDPEPILHSTRFVLVDAGTIRGFYDSGDAVALDALTRDARRLAADARKERP